MFSSTTFHAMNRPTSPNKMQSPRASHDRRRSSVQQVVRMARQKFYDMSHTHKPEEESEIEQADLSFVRHRPEGLKYLCTVTKFSKREIQLLYRGFKEGCPNGIVHREKFKEIYSQFFPQGDPSRYANFVFNTFDRDKNGHISFDEFVIGLSVLSRGSIDEKLRWIFELYDTDRDGQLRRSDVYNVVSSMYDMMGKSTEPKVYEDTIDSHVNYVFNKMDENKDGKITVREFLDACSEDSDVRASLAVFETKFL